MSQSVCLCWVKNVVSPVSAIFVPKDGLADTQDSAMCVTMGSQEWVSCKSIIEKHTGKDEDWSLPCVDDNNTSLY